MDLNSASNIIALASCQNETDITEKYTADPFGTVLIPRNHWMGRLCSWFYNTTEWFQWGHESTRLLSTIEKIRINLTSLVTFLHSNERHPSEKIYDLLEQTFSSVQRRKIIQVMTFLNVSPSISSFQKAQQAIAIPLLTSLVGIEPPWESIDQLLQGHELTIFEKDLLDHWITSMNEEGRSISSLLFLSFLEATVQHFYPTDPQQQQRSRISSLASRLQQEGLELISFEDIMNDRVPKEIEDTPSIKLGKVLNLSLPIPLSSTAYELPNHPNQMILYSAAPMQLGIWNESLTQSNPPIPYIKRLSWGNRQQYCVVERIINTFSKWRRKVKKKELISVISTIIQSLLQGRSTPNLHPSQLFVTSSHKICLLQPITQSSSFTDISKIEKFLKKLSRNNTKIIQDVFHQTDFTSHPTAKIYLHLLKSYGSLVSEATIRQTLSREGNDHLFSQFSHWRENLLQLERKIEQKWQHLFPDRPLPSHQQITHALNHLAYKIGYVTCFPKKLAKHVCQEIARLQP